jgi:hypothetical protein
MKDIIRMKFNLSQQKRLELGLHAAHSYMYQQDKIWAAHSNDKIDIADALFSVIRNLHKALPRDEPMRALSIGSSNEPQFRILASAFNAGFYLLDIEEKALSVVDERVKRQCIEHVHLIQGDYQTKLADSKAVQEFRRTALHDNRLALITMHHSLYYSPRTFWADFLAEIYHGLLSPAADQNPSAAMHAVLMASQSTNEQTTTWLYNHFSQKFFNHSNDQDLFECAEEIAKDQRLENATIFRKSSLVQFFVDDFEKFMSVVWMILLHPNVHPYTEDQQCEVIEWVYEKFWSRKLPLLQSQDHMVVYRGRQAPTPGWVLVR